MRSTDKQIRVIRERTGQSDYSYALDTGVLNAGLSQDFYTEALNEAQDYLQSQIISIKADLFLEDEVVDLVANTESYDLAGRVFGSTKIKSAQYSSNGQLNQYVPLHQRTLAERDTNTATDPGFYIPLGTRVLINPITTNSTGKVRFTYFKELDDLDIRRGTVSGTPSGTSVILSTSNLYAYDIGQAEYICICDKFGVPLLRGGKVSSYNSGTQTITLAANVSTYLVSGVALADLANQYVTIGRYSTTHSELPDICERFLLTYAQKKAHQKEENAGSIFEQQDMQMMLESILGAYSEKTEDVTQIPITDEEILY